jgi:hypothetical protein
MTDLQGLIEKHRSNGLLIDTNLLLLYVVGRTNKNRIPNFKRTQKYTIEDFELLTDLVGQFRVLITTPHVLTEVSNLAALHGAELSAFRGLFKQTIEEMDEQYDESRLIAGHSSFERLGLADAAISTLSRRSFLVLTDDLDLHAALSRAGVDAINFNHIRTLFWQ